MITDTFTKRIEDSVLYCLSGLEYYQVPILVLLEDIEKITHPETKYWFEHELRLSDILHSQRETLFLSLIMYLCYDEYIPPRLFDVSRHGGRIGEQSLSPGSKIIIGDKTIQQIEWIKRRIPEDFCYEFEIKVTYKS